MTLRFPVRVGELSYQNTLPFRLDARWNTTHCPSPRQLAKWAEENRIDAGVIPVVEAWRLENEFEPVGGLGIAVKNKAMSVLLFSRRSWKDLAGAQVGVTDHTSTSVQLLRVLLERRDGIKAAFKTGFSPDDDARLVIGDPALTPGAGLKKDFPLVFDLAGEWHRWQNLPFVFARWMVRRSVAPYWKEELADALHGALNQFERERARLSRQSARALKVHTSTMLQYFDGLTYQLGQKEDQAEALFRVMATHKDRTLCC